MFQSQQQQQLQQSSLTYFPNSSNSIPNSLLSFPQPPILPSQSLLLPPGTDTYAHLGQFALNHVGFESQSSAVGLNSGSNNDWTNQSLVNNVIGSTPDRSNLSHLARCDVCNIECNTKDVYDRHLFGKKHQRNWQVKLNHATAVFPETSNTFNNVSVMAQTGNVGGQMTFGALAVANVLELARKKQQILNAGASAGSVRMCTICNVACNSDDVFAKHLSGRRHAAQAGLIAVDGVGPYLAAIRANDHFWNKGKKTTNINQSTWCDVCKINCTSKDVYAKHLSGKKHLKNLEILEKSNNGTCYPSSIDAPDMTNLIIGAAENPAADGSSAVNVQKSEKTILQSGAPKEDLETKTRKVVEGGAAAAAVRVCVICNVVCNSQKVFNYHLTGQKHAAMVRKLVDAGKPTRTT